MSLAQLFYYREAIRNRVKRWHSKKHLPSRQQFTLESLEPRVLLSATPTEVFANQALEPAAITVPTGSLPSLDIDLNGQADALSDGIVIMRHLFGFTENALTDGVVDPAGQRTDPTAIQTYLNSISTALDVDLNQNADALSDGIVIIQSLFGFTGTALTDGVVDPLGQRTDPAVIAAFLDNMNPQRELVAPLLTAGLQQDTGGSATDSLTNNATITGTIADLNPIAGFAASLDFTPTAPSIRVTNLNGGAIVSSGVMVVEFSTANFLLGDQGETHLNFYVDADPTPYRFFNGATDEVLYQGVHTHFIHWHSSASIELHGPAAGGHQIQFVLADATDQALTNPEATTVFNFSVAPAPQGEFVLEPFIAQANFPTSMAFAPDGRLFYTELFTGAIRVIDQAGQLQPAPWYQLTVETGGEQGLLGLAMDPNFATNGFVYAYHTADGPGRNRVVRLQEIQGVGTNETVILDNLPASTNHNGGKLTFGPDGKLYVVIGDTEQPDRAQELTFLGGKILRINKDGSIPTDNPFPNSPVYSYGHRNSFGITFHPHSGDLWETENGVNDNDEVNLIVAGGNYGWPIVAGVANDQRFIDPLITYTPTIAPTGIAVVSEHSIYPAEYQNNLFFGDFNRGAVTRVVLTGAGLNQVASVSVANPGGQGGLLDLIEGPDGKLYASYADQIARLVLSNPNVGRLTNVAAVNQADGTVLVTWNTDGPSDAQVEYGRTTAYGLLTSSSFLTDAAVHAPPVGGQYDYNQWGPEAPGFPDVGGTYIDPVFGGTIRRLTNTEGNPNQEDIYGHHWANANGTYAFSRQADGLTDTTLKIISTTNGAEVYTDQPLGSIAADIAWDALDPDKYYYYDGPSLMRWNLTGQTPDLMYTFPAALEPNGGSLNTQDRSGRYFTIRYGGSNQVWDSQTRTIYAGSVAPLDPDTGWVAITPDGNYLVTVAGSSPSPNSEHYSYPINHQTQSIGSTPTQFWGLCGDHGALVSATDGKNYFISFDCADAPGLWRVDITLDQAGRNEVDQLNDNRLLLPLRYNPVDTNSGHLSAVSKGPNQNWVFFSSETFTGDDFDAVPTDWQAYKQEIIAINVITLEVQRYAHHRSRGLSTSYYAQPRISSAWDGSIILWTSNYNTSSPTGYADLYGLLTPIMASPSTSHAVTIGNLESNTTYHFRVRSRDGSGALAASGDFTFTTGIVPSVTRTVDVLSDLQPDGRFTFDRPRLEQIFGGPLLDGRYVLHLQAADARGNVSGLRDVTFTVDTTAPAVPTFDLDPAFDTLPVGDQQTSFAVVTLTGRTDGTVSVALSYSSITALSNSTGTFTLAGVPLTEGPNLLTVRAMDGAGNQSEASQTITLVLGAPAVGSAVITTTGSRAEILSPSETIALDEGERSNSVALPSDLLTRLDDIRHRGRFRDITGAGMTAVVIDTGIDVDHPFFGPDIDGNGVADRIVFQWDFADNDADASDRSGHGSHIASLIGSEDLTYPGVAPDADLIALKVFSDGGTGTFANVEQALQWVVVHAAEYSVDVVNLSLGDGQNWTVPGAQYGIGDEFAALTEAGVLLIAAAGNNFFTAQSLPGVAYPAADPNVIGVGAVWTADFGGPWRWSSGAIDLTTGPDNIASFSQRDPNMTEIFAPGARLTGANHLGGIVTMQGTSQAAAYLSGTALLAQQFAERDMGRKLTPEEFANLVVLTGKKIVDGDDEQDNVVNTGDTFARVDVLRLAKGIHRYAAWERGEGDHHHSDHGLALAYAQRGWLKAFVSDDSAAIDEKGEELLIALPA